MPELMGSLERGGLLESYNEFAEVYDLFMEDVDYGSWCRYIKELFRLYGKEPGKILDTACGTGNITIPMSLDGYEMCGLDLSESMLSIAESKARAAKRKIMFLNQDMTRMSLHAKYQAVLCMCDGVNYITGENELRSYFKSVYNSLDKDGIFIFDISSYGKLSGILGNNTFYEEKNNKHYIWNNNFDAESDTIEMELIFFVPRGELYRKFEERHIQKAYKWEYLSESLKAAGFEQIRVFGDFSLSGPDKDSERIFFTAVRG